MRSFNVQRVALLLAGLQSGRADAIAGALDDRLAPAVPAPAVPVAAVGGRRRARAGALGCVLSGAGPSVLAAVSGDADRVAARDGRRAHRRRNRRSCPRLAVDTEGAVSTRA